MAFCDKNKEEVLYIYFASTHGGTRMLTRGPEGSQGVQNDSECPGVMNRMMGCLHLASIFQESNWVDNWCEVIYHRRQVRDIARTGLARYIHSRLPGFLSMLSPRQSQ